MTFQAFTALEDMLYQQVTYDYLKYGYTCSPQQPVHTDITVAIGLSCLAGSSYLDFKNVNCSSICTVYKHRLCFIHTVTLCDLLKLKFPTSAVEICRAQAWFCDISSNYVMSVYVGSIDGLLVFIKCPSMKDSNNNPFP